MNNKPIGVFDSGYGGLTILKEIVETLPQYDYLYLGDNARAPYGNKSFETVYDYTLQCVKWFFDQGCSLVILACNTASAKALRSIQQNDLPELDQHKRVLGVIRPTSEVIGNYSKTHHVGVLGTTGTIQSESYLIEISKFFPEITVAQEACPEWVSLVEENKYNSPEADSLVKLHIDNVLQKDKSIDTFLLACTHYPLIKKEIDHFYKNSIDIIDSTKVVATEVYRVLKEYQLLNTLEDVEPEHEFFVSDYTSSFEKTTSLFFGKKVKLQLAE
jgi:glutamate racemase